MIKYILSKIKKAKYSDEMITKLFQGGTWVFLGKFFTSIFGLANGILLTRIIRPEDVGFYDISISIVSVVIILAGLGLGRTVIRLIGEARAKEQPELMVGIIKSVVYLGFFGVFLAGVIYLIFTNKFAHLFNNKLEINALQSVILIVIISATFSNLLGDIFKGLLHFIWAEALGWKGLFSGFFLLIGLFSIWMLDIDVSVKFLLYLTALSIALGVLFGGIKLFSFSKDISGNIDNVKFNHLLSISIPILLVQIVPVMTSQANILMLGAIETSSTVAVYGRVIKIAALISTPTLFYRKIIAPFISELYERKENKKIEQIIRITANYLFIGVFIVSIPFILWSGKLLSLTFGDFYSKGGQGLIILLIVELFNVASGACVQLLLMTGYQKVLFVITFSVGLFSIISTFILIKSFGLIGSIIGRTIYIFGVNFCASFVSYHITGIKSWVDFRSFGLN